jgi:hypothetical protein
MSAKVTELDYLKGFLNFMQNQGRLSEKDLADYNRWLEAKRTVDNMMNSIK